MGFFGRKEKMPAMGGDISAERGFGQVPRSEVDEVDAALATMREEAPHNRMDIPGVTDAPQITMQKPSVEAIPHARMTIPGVNDVEGAPRVKTMPTTHTMPAPVAAPTPTIDGKPFARAAEEGIANVFANHGTAAEVLAKAKQDPRYTSNDPYAAALEEAAKPPATVQSLAERLAPKEETPVREIGDALAAIHKVAEKTPVPEVVPAPTPVVEAAPAPMPEIGNEEPTVYGKRFPGTPIPASTEGIVEVTPVESTETSEGSAEEAAVRFVELAKKVGKTNQQIQAMVLAALLKEKGQETIHKAESVQPDTSSLSAIEAAKYEQLMASGLEDAARALLEKHTGH